MIDADMPTSPTEEEINESELSLINVVNEINSRHLNATIYLTQDMTSSRVRMFITRIGLFPNYELAISGNNTGEKLSDSSYSEQKAILERSKLLVEACHICGENEIDVKGFMPQSFDQNEDTYRALDGLDIEYNAGFQAGILYAPGHEVDVWPYKVEGHKFYAVPLSTYDLYGERVPLHDLYMVEEGLTGAQWYDLLKGRLDEASENGEPMIVALTASVSGKGDYLNALDEFLDYALSNDARFVTTRDLVTMSGTGIHEASAPDYTLEEDAAHEEDSGESDSPDCEECNKPKEQGLISMPQNETEEPLSLDFKPDFKE